MPLRTLGVLLVAALIHQAAGAPATAESSRWWSHVAVLADDNMEGRDTGSPAHRRAADYVSSQFQKAGLLSAGTEGYLQPVALKVRRINEARSSLSLVRDGQTVPLVLGDDAAISLRIDPVSTLAARLVFVGYGLKIPEQGIDDLAGLDLKGAVVVYISATPKTLPGPLQAHFGSAVERWKMYQAAGAVGTISIANPRTSDVPWARASLARLQPSMSLADETLEDAPGQQLALAMNPAQADKLLAGSGHTFAEILTQMDAGKNVPGFVLPTQLRATVAVERSTVESHNVVGLLRGSDPRLRDEYVVLSAHLDHLGVGEPIQGDRINNGAMDNASGIAALVEVARGLHESQATPARSILFLAVTGEEKGQLGSRWFAAHPTVPRPGIVANVNTDMFLPLFPLKMLMVLGLDESALGEDIRATAKQLGLAVQADPEPQRNRFVRSDQYSFIKIGVPALSMKVGYEANTPEAAAAAKWTADRYHAPSDDLNQPVDLAAGEKYIEVLRDLAVRIANRPDRPGWNETSFFKRFARTGAAGAAP